MRVAALYDIHGNLPALDAVLADVRASARRSSSSSAATCCRGRCRARRSTRLQSLDVPRAVHPRQRRSRDAGRGRRAPVGDAGIDARGCCAGAATQLDDAAARGRRRLAAARPPRRARPRSVLFCHATPRSDEEIVTRLMPDDVLRPIFDGVADLVVCGHTHMQFDRTVGAHARRQRRQRRHAVRAPGWGLLAAARTAASSCAGPPTTVVAAAEAVRRTAYPGAEEFARVNLLEPPDMLEAFTRYGLSQLEGVADGAMRRPDARGRSARATDCDCRCCSRRWPARARPACRLRWPTPAAWARWARWSARPTAIAAWVAEVRGGERRTVPAEYVDARSAAAARPERRGARAIVHGALGAARAAVGRRRGARRYRRCSARCFSRRGPRRCRRSWACCRRPTSSG